MNSRISVLGLVLCLFGCGTGSDAPDTGPPDAGDVPDAGRDSGVDSGVDAGGMRTCSTMDLTACEYVPDRFYTLGLQTERMTTYADETGEDRAVAFAIRLPEEAALPAPIVIWSHGGATGRSDPTTVGTEFSGIFLRSGYAVIAIAHTPRGPSSYDALCAAVGAGDCTPMSCTTSTECVRGAGEQGTCLGGGCRYWKHLNWDRPHDVSAVIDWVERNAMAGGPLDGNVDPTRIVYAGHSAGGGAAMMVAGATRDFGGTQRLSIDSRPMAFISTSPQGPGDDGFVTESFTGSACTGLAADPSICLTRPHLTLTGLGDDTTAHVAENRRPSFELAPATGDRFLLWLLDEAGRHTTFNYESDECEGYASTEGLDPSIYPARCTEHLRWLRFAAVAFLDAYVRDSARARAYLASDSLEIVSAGGLTFERR